METRAKNDESAPAESLDLAQHLSMIAFERQMAVIANGNPKKFSSPRLLFRRMVKRLAADDPAERILACQTVVLFGRSLALSYQAATVDETDLTTQVNISAAANRATLQCLANLKLCGRMREARNLLNELGFNHEKTPLPLV